MSERLPLLQSLIAGHTDRADERTVLQILSESRPEELNDLLAGVDLDALFASIDNRLLGPDNRDRLRTELLGRAAHLTLANAAGLTHALQTGRTSRDDELAIRDLFLGFRGAELTAFKNALSQRTDQHDLEALVFADIDAADIRDEILAHIAAEAEAVSGAEVKVLSDIDDTCIARIHEARYPKGTLYPGVLAFYEALDVGVENPPLSRGDLVFVSARPGDVFGLMERHSKTALRNAGIANSSVLTGTLTALRSKDAMAGRKHANVSNYRRLFPEYDIVFIGDSGQGDVILAERIRGEWPDAVRTAFIHDVVATPETERRRLDALGVHVFDTYVGAATRAHALGLITADGLADVIEETRRGLDAVAWESPEQRHAVEALVARDCAAAG